MDEGSLGSGADGADQFSETRATSNKYLPNWLEWLEEALEPLSLIPGPISEWFARQRLGGHSGAGSRVLPSQGLRERLATCGDCSRAAAH